MARWVTKKEDEWKDIIGTMPSVTEEQQAVSTPLSTYLAEALAGVEKYPTFADWSTTNIPTTSPYSEALLSEILSGKVPDIFGGELGKEAMAAYSEALSGQPVGMFGGELGGEAMGAYAEALKGVFPEDYFTTAIYNPMKTQFLQDIMPAIRESYVGTGAITGTEVGERLGREAGRMEESLMSIRAQLAQQAKERSYQMSLQYQTAYQSAQEQAKQRQLIAAGNYQQAYQNAVQYAQQRQLSGITSYQQYQLELLKIGYDNYARQHPDAATILQSALSYLNIPMMAAYQKPEPTTGIWGSSTA